MPFSRLHYNEKLILRKVGNKHYTCTVNQSINQSVNQQIFKVAKVVQPLQGPLAG